MNFNDLTRQTLDDADAGRNIVHYQNIEECFKDLGMSFSEEKETADEHR